MRCCCYCLSIKQGSYLAAAWSLVYSGVQLGDIYHEESQQSVLGSTRPNQNLTYRESLINPPGWKPGELTVIYSFLLATYILVMISIPFLFIGIKKEVGKFMIPWLATSSMTTLSDSTINLYILICHKKIRFEPLTAFIFTSAFFIFIIQMYSILCVYYQYRRSKEGVSSNLLEVERVEQRFIPKHPVLRGMLSRISEVDEEKSSGKSESKPVEKISEGTKSGDSPITISANSDTLANCDKIAIEKKLNQDHSIEKTDENVKFSESQNILNVQEKEMKKKPNPNINERNSKRPVGNSFDNKVKKYTVRLTDSEDIKIFSSNDYEEDKNPLIISQKKNNTKYRPKNLPKIILTNPPTDHEKLQECEEKLNDVVFQENYKTKNQAAKRDSKTVKNENSKKLENDEDESFGKHLQRRDSTFKGILSSSFGTNLTSNITSNKTSNINSNITSNRRSSMTSNQTYNMVSNLTSNIEQKINLFFIQSKENINGSIV